MEGEFRNHTRSGGFSLWVGVAAFAGLVLGLALAIAYIYPQLARKHEGLSAQELTAALGIRYWEFTIPENDGNQSLELEIQDGDDVTTHDAATGWTPGERVLVTIRPVMQNKKLDCSVIGEGTQCRMTIDNPFAGLGALIHAPNGCSANDRWLIKGNRTGSTGVGPLTQEADPGDVIMRMVMTAR
jgi:hypothetical protein